MSPTRKATSQSQRAKPTGKSAARSKSSGRSMKTAADAKPVLLSGGNPRIAKSQGDAPVQAYIDAMPGWKRDIGRRIDALIVRTVPNVRKAVKWNSPFYGIDGQGWFVGLHTFTNFVKVTFFAGTSLRPAPSGGKAPAPSGAHAKAARWIDVHEDDLDEDQLTNWVKQAAALKGWLTADIESRG